MALEVCASCSAAYAVGLLACPQCGSTVRRGERATPMVPQIEVACQTEGCRAEGKVAVVRLPSVGVNLVAWPTVHCTLCGYPVAIVTAWPRSEGDDEMPKITVHGGPSIAPVGQEREAPGTGEPMTPIEDGEVSGDGAGSALPPVGQASEPKDEPDAVAEPEGQADDDGPEADGQPDTEPDTEPDEPEAGDGDGDQEPEKKPARRRSTRAKAQTAAAKGSTGK